MTSPIPPTATATHSPLKIALKGEALLDSPAYNKGAAFTREERRELGLMGRLPWTVSTLDMQIKRAYDQYQSHESDIRKNGFLQSLRTQNWVLFYALLNKYLSEMPIIYTPTEATAISSYSHLFRRPDGLYLSPTMSREEVEAAFLEAVGGRNLELVVVSDGEAILGIGDQGSGGIGISSAKGVIYTLIGGVNPAGVLPVVLDVGTNNEELLGDGLYMGLQEKRISGEPYFEFVDQFVQLVRKYQPKCLLHFEDFGVSNAQILLDKYRDQHSIFNDDIQGTGAVTLAALQAALLVTGEKLSQQRIITFGAGSAGLGIARQIRDAAVLLDGASVEEASKMFWLVDRHGLLKEGIRGEIRDGIDEAFIRTEGEWGEGETGLLEVVKRVGPTVLIGTSTMAGGFTEEVVREMAKHCDRPIIFPLSNPTRLCECRPADASKWTNGKALLATGSPFDPVDIPGTSEKYVIAECNNALIYPGIGMGAIACQARKVTDMMIIAATKALADLSPAKKDPKKSLLPDFADSQAVNFEVALAVIKQAVKDGQTDLDVKEGDLRGWLEERIWRPEYVPYVFDEDGAK